MTPESWIGLAERLGVSATVLAFVGLGIYRVACWLAPLLERWLALALKRLEGLPALEQRLTALETRQETVWMFALRRGGVEAFKKGAPAGPGATPGSKASTWLSADLAKRLREFYKAEGKGLSDAALAEEIEKRFGDELVQSVCMQHGLSHGACLVIAVEAAREEG